MEVETQCRPAPPGSEKRVFAAHVLAVGGQVDAAPVDQPEGPVVAVMAGLDEQAAVGFPPRADDLAGPPAQALAGNDVEELTSSTARVEWAAVERSAVRQSSSARAPQLTTRRSLPTLISKASVPAWAWRSAPGGAGWPKSAMISVPPADSL